MKDEMFGVPAGGSEHLTRSPEHWERLLTLAEPVRSSQKSPKELVESCANGNFRAESDYDICV